MLEGVVKSGQELEAFVGLPGKSGCTALNSRCVQQIESFNHSHPLFMVIESNDSKELILQRQRGVYVAAICDELPC